MLRDWQGTPKDIIQGSASHELPNSHVDVVFLLSQVDVWSIGVILFQSIYGKKVVWTIGAILIKPLSLSLSAAIRSQSLSGIHTGATHNVECQRGRVSCQASSLCWSKSLLLSVLGIFCGILKCWSFFSSNSWNGASHTRKSIVPTF